MTAHDEDLADIAQAREAEAQAEPLLLALPGLVLSFQKGRTRGPRQEAMRGAARTRPDARAAHALFAAADRAYWRCVVRHDRFIHGQARRLGSHVPRLRGEPDTILQLLRIGWFRGLIRFEPATGVKLVSYAPAWGKAYLQSCDDRQSDVPVGRRKRDATGGWTTRWLEELDQPICLGDGDEVRRQNLLVDDLALPVDEQACLSIRAARLHRKLTRLPERELRVIQSRFYEDGSLIEAGRALGGVTNERARQVQIQAVSRLRTLMEVP